ncbi:MAG: hypothetical protein V4542_03320 [Pseudomonadota bacterium]
MTELHGKRLQKPLWATRPHQSGSKFINAKDSLPEYQNELKTAASPAGGARTTKTTP